MSVNVNRNVTDAFYRYKMPKILAKVEGKGNGIKTVIVNMPDVARALARPPTYTTKYFGCELGAQTNFDLKNERFIINGSHECSKLQDLLDGFIKKFVLCPECDNPETNLIVSKKKEMISQRCIACGYTGNIDMRHKLTTFILKNPPETQQDHSGETPSKKDSKKSKRSSKTKQNGNDEGERTSPEINAQEQSAAARSGDGQLYAPPAKDEDDDVDWGEDTSAEAMKARMLELTDAAKSLALNADLERTQQERVDLFYSFVKRKKDSNSLAGSDKAILTEADLLDIKDKAPLVLAEILFTENILKEMKDYRLIFLRFTHENKKAQKYLMGGFEQLVGNVFKETLMPKVPHILKGFYDLDYLEEDIIIDWDKKVSKKYVTKEVAKEIHEKASPFITWLKEAESEESDEEEEDLEIEYSSHGPVGTHLVNPPKNAAPAQEDGGDDEVNIDDI